MDRRVHRSAQFRPGETPFRVWPLRLLGYGRPVKISVVIPALDEAERIPTVLDSAMLPGIEVVVVDGGSRDGSASRARQAGARVLETGRGRARQLARGVAATRGDVLLLLHADTLLPRDWPEMVRGALAEPAVVGGAFRFAFDSGGPALGLLAWGARLRGSLLRLPYGDQALFVRRAVLECIGGIPQVPILEDLDLVRQMKRRGRIALLPAPALTSARRHLERGVFKTAFVHILAALAWRLGVDRARIAAWLRG